jgi:hypothetical protein
MGLGRDYDFLSVQCAIRHSASLPPAALADGTDASQSVPSSSIADSLKELADLENSGALTDARRKGAKRKLLGTPRQTLRLIWWPLHFSAEGLCILTTTACVGVTDRRKEGLATLIRLTTTTLGNG